MTLSPYGVEQVDMATALQHRVAALNALSSLLIKEEIYGLAAAEEDAVLAIILLLVLHDVSVLANLEFVINSPTSRIRAHQSH